MATVTPEELDQHVGLRMRVGRMALGLGQRELALRIGVTYQQVHKYERGHTRVSAGQLYLIARVLKVPVSYFFEGLEVEAAPPLGARERRCLELLHDFARIPDERHQEALQRLARALAAESGPPKDED